MLHLRLPLYVKILLWFFLNLAVLTALGLWFMLGQFRLGLGWMLAGPGGGRLEQFGEALTQELRSVPEADWPRVLNRHEGNLGMTIALFGSDGRQRLGRPLQVPAEVRPKLTDKRNASERPPPRRPPPRRPPPRHPPPLDRRRDPLDAAVAPPKPRFMLRSMDPTLYWTGIHLDLTHGAGEERRALTLVLVSDSLTGRGFFLNLWPWAGLVAGALALSALIWLPVVGGMTRAIRRTNAASKRIAAGGFDVRLPEGRNDELGELAASVNAMAGQLGDYVSQQRRITADIAHELCSPIARMQMALGVVEQRGTAEQEVYLKKLDKELQHMAKLVEEVLAFAKSETLCEQESATAINLGALVTRVLAREAVGAEVEVDVPAGLSVHAMRGALDRALGNVVRNAVRYAAHAGPIRIHAFREGTATIIRVSDQGPGVPAESLKRLFEPFYRPEAARTRHTGGSGLGLAITKRCIEATGGTVTARLREPSGLDVEIVLP